MLLPVTCVAVFACCCAVVWIAGVLYLNDFSVPAQHLKSYKHALVIFPHPDDETNVAGLVWQLHRRHVPVTLAVLTKGERGTDDAHLDPKLRTTRTREMQLVGHILGTDLLVHEDFGDGQVMRNRPAVRVYVESLLNKVQPDLIVTYDLAGLYGHEDHIACSEIVTELVRANHPHATLWYVTFPQHLLTSSHLPTYMAKDPAFVAKRAKANVRVAVGRSLIAKVRTIYAHRSQRLSFQKSLPLPLPLWFVHSMRLFEYFEKVQ